jgi:hypothetical protein
VGRKKQNLWNEQRFSSEETRESNGISLAGGGRGVSGRISRGISYLKIFAKD